MGWERDDKRRVSASEICKTKRLCLRALWVLQTCSFSCCLAKAGCITHHIVHGCTVHLSAYWLPCLEGTRQSRSSAPGVLRKPSWDGSDAGTSSDLRGGVNTMNHTYPTSQLLQVSPMNNIHFGNVLSDWLTKYTSYDETGSSQDDKNYVLTGYRFGKT